MPLIASSAATGSTGCSRVHRRAGLPSVQTAKSDSWDLELNRTANMAKEDKENSGWSELDDAQDWVDEDQADDVGKEAGKQEPGEEWNSSTDESSSPPSPASNG